MTIVEYVNSGCNLTSPEKTYRLGYGYLDKGKSHPDDQFARWLNIPGSGILNSPGVRAPRFVHRWLKDPKFPPYIVLVTTETKGGTHNPWDDIVDHSTGSILYWGDAKYDERRRLLDFDGNACLKAVFDEVLYGNRAIVPPILHFSKPKKGVVEFNGLCLLEKLELTWFEDKGHPVRNFRAELAILDEEEVSVEWLHARACASSIDSLVAAHGAPPAWRRYLAGYVDRLNLWKARIRSPVDQLPATGVPEATALLQLSSLHPTLFEAVTVAVFRQLTSVRHSITRTRPVGDRGFDFFGHFTLPRPIDYEIEFLGEAKRYARTTCVGSVEVSRLVARLGRGQYGLYVTTSYFTPQAQAEVLEHGYPLKLMAGMDLINMMIELRLISKGRIDPNWLTSVEEAASTEVLRLPPRIRRL